MTNVNPKPPPIEKGFEGLVPTLEVSPFGEFNARNIAAATKANTALLKGATTYWAQLSSFVGRRLRADAEFVRALNTCQSGEEAVRTQHRFVAAMIADYFGEAQKLLTIGADTAHNLVDPLEDRAEEAVHFMEERNRREDAA